MFTYLLMFVALICVCVGTAVEVRNSKQEESFLQMGLIETRPIQIPYCVLETLAQQRGELEVENQAWLARIDTAMEASDLIYAAIKELEKRVAAEKIAKVVARDEALRHAEILVVAANTVDSMEAFLSAHEKVNQLRQIAWA